MSSHELLKEEQKKEENKTLKYIKSFYKIIKDNLALVVLIPTMLGGIWQFINLLNIGLPYVRFFSVTQLISDGLIILIILFFIAFVTFFYLFLILLITSVNPESETEPNHKIVTLFLISSSLLIFINFSFLNNHFNFGYNIPHNFRSEIFKLTILIPLTAINAHYGWEILNIVGEYLESRRKKTNIFFEKIYFNILISFQILAGVIGVFSIFLSIYVFFGFFSVIVGSPQDLIVPENLQNTSNIRRLVEKNYNIDSKKIEIAYLNDKYIFIRHIEISYDSVKKLQAEEEPVPFKIIILKIDELFNTEKNEQKSKR